MELAKKTIDDLFNVCKVITSTCSKEEGVPLLSTLTMAGALLKKQVPVQAIKATDHDTWCGDVWTVCPGCRIAIDDGDRYCRHCGQAIELGKE